MTQSEQISQDLSFVRRAVAKRESADRTPSSILIVWAVYVLVGYTLLDLRPTIGNWFLVIGGVVGGFISMWLGKRAAVQEGEIDRAEGIKHAMHWGSIFLGIIGVIAIALTQPALRNDQVIGQLIVLVIAIVYFLGGVHFDRRFIVIGLLLMVGAVVVGLIHFHPWTILGAMLSAALLVTALLNRRD